MRYRARISFFSLVLSLGLATDAPAENGNSDLERLTIHFTDNGLSRWLVGVVFDESGSPTHGARVDLVDADDFPVASPTFTDAHGRFSFLRPAPGTSFIRANDGARVTRAAVRTATGSGHPLSTTFRDDLARVGQNPRALSVTTIEDFDDGSIADYANVGSITGGVDGAAAHDGAFGLSISEQTFPGWIYRSGSLVTENQAVSVWVRPGSAGRAYVGFGSNATGTFALAVGVNTNSYVLQYVTYGNPHEEFSEIPFVWTPGKWYRLTAIWLPGGAIMSSIYDTDGVTPLAGTTGTSTTYGGVMQGGNAWRGFGDAHSFDELSGDTDITGVETTGRTDRLAALLQNRPNPFNPYTAIPYFLKETGYAQLSVFDGTGRLVAHLIDDVVGAGQHRISWNGRDDRGAALPSGVYYYRFAAPGVSESRRMVLLR